MFGELNGAEIFTFKKEEFERFCGIEEGSKLNGVILVQKSLCGVIWNIYSFFIRFIDIFKRQL